MCSILGLKTLHELQLLETGTFIPTFLKEFTLTLSKSRFVTFVVALNGHVMHHFICTLDMILLFSFGHYRQFILLTGWVLDQWLRSLIVR